MTPDSSHSAWQDQIAIDAFWKDRTYRIALAAQQRWMAVSVCVRLLVALVLAYVSGATYGVWSALAAIFSLLLTLDAWRILPDVRAGLAHLRHRVRWAVGTSWGPYRRGLAAENLELYGEIFGRHPRCTSCGARIDAMNRLGVFGRGYVYSSCNDKNCIMYGKPTMAAWLDGMNIDVIPHHIWSISGPDRDDD
jgi:hypothetical protein